MINKLNQIWEDGKQGESSCNYSRPHQFNPAILSCPISSVVTPPCCIIAGKRETRWFFSCWKRTTYISPSPGSAPLKSNQNIGNPLTMWILIIFFSSMDKFKKNSNSLRTYKLIKYLDFFSYNELNFL